MHFISNLISFIRPLDWRAYILLGTFGLLSTKYLVLDRNIVCFFISLLSYIAFSFSINNYFDVEEDKHKKSSKNPLVNGKISQTHAKVIITSLFCIAIAASAMLGVKPFIFMLFMLFLSGIYSAKPIKLKGRFILDVVSHALFFGSLIFLYPFVAFKIGISNETIMIAMLIAIVSINLELRNHYEDFESDKKAGLRTTVIVLGKKKTRSIIFLINLLYPLIFLLLFYQIFGICKGLVASVLVSIIYYVYIYVNKKSIRAFDFYTNITFLIFLFTLYSV